MSKIGYSCILDGAEVHHWSGSPSYFEYRDRSGNLVFKFKSTRLKDTTRGLDGRLYTIAERHRVDRPTRFHNPGIETVSFDGARTIVDPRWTAMEIGDAKARRKAELRQIAVDRLTATNPDVLRALELGQSVPGAIATRRAGIRNRVQEMSADIDALSTLEDLEAYVDTNWP